MSFLKLIKMVLGTLPFILFAFFNTKINLSKENRARQFLMPVITLIYCIFAMIFLDKISALVMLLIETLSEYIPFIQSLNIEIVLMYAVNILLVIGNMYLKLILLPIFNKIWSSNSVMNFTSAAFYDYESDVDNWFVKKSYANFRGFCRGIYYGLLAASAFLFTVALSYPEIKAFEAIPYPFFSVLVLGEIICYLCGMTKGEFVKDILGEDEESYKVANYGMLRKILRDLYGDKVLYEGTYDTTNNLSDTFDALSEMAESDESINHIMGEYFLALKKTGKILILIM